jgi:hypothetical protein
MTLSHAGSQIECTVPEETRGRVEQGQLVQVIGTVEPVRICF